MKIVFIGGRDIHILGGIENYMLNLTRELSRLGHECIVWCESDHRGEKMLDGVRVIYHKGPKSNLLCKPWCGLKATLKTVFGIKGVSFIHYNGWGPSLCCWIPRLFGIPSLMEGHGLEWQRSKYSARSQRVMKFMEGITARMNHHLAMCSEGQVEYFRKEYGLESVCIPGAVNLPTDNAGTTSGVLHRFGLEKGKYFLFMGRLVPDKNPDYLIRAFEKASLDESIKLVIAGSNDALPEYVSSLLHLGEGDPRVIFTGAVYGEDKACLLRNAYCFCLPSTIEGLSIALMEAASFRLPIIASNIDANREFLKEDALYVRPENEDDLVGALRFAASHPEVLKKQKDINFGKVIKKYTWDKVAVKYVEYLHSIGINN